MKVRKNKRGRPKIELTKKQKDSAVWYIRASGLWKKRLADYLQISRPTLDKILKADPNFFTRLKAADAEFCKRKIQKARPEFILKTKYREEFPEQIKVEHGVDKELEKALDRMSKVLPK